MSDEPIRLEPRTLSLDELSAMAGRRWAREDRERLHLEVAPDPFKRRKTEPGRARPHHGGRSFTTRLEEDL